MKSGAGAFPVRNTCAQLLDPRRNVRREGATPPTRNSEPRDPEDQELLSGQPECFFCQRQAFRRAALLD